MQKSKLSAFMDGESVDNEVINAISKDKTLQETWSRYHLVRDILRGDTSKVIHMDIAQRVSEALQDEPLPFIKENQPHPKSWYKLPFWKRLQPWFGHITQAGIAAAVSIAVIIGVQSANQETDPPQPTISAFNRFDNFPINTMASPVSYETQAADVQSSADILAYNQRKRITLLQDYELQRRIHAEPVTVQTGEKTSKTIGKIEINLNQD